MSFEAHFPADLLADWTRDARAWTLNLMDDLDDRQLLGPELIIVNPPLWETGHVAWFQEKWVLRRTCGQPPFHEDVDRLYDSIAIEHDTRWDLPLHTRRETVRYLEDTCNRVLEQLGSGPPDPRIGFFALYSIFHEDMHAEAFIYTRQTLSYPRPRWLDQLESVGDGQETGPCPGDVEIPGGSYRLGGSREEPFVFDNEKWAHPVSVAPFVIARAPVTQEEFAAFVDDGGYERAELWDPEGRSWLTETQATHPVYWKWDSGGWWRRDFDQWRPIEPHWPMHHVNWHEASAYCRWAGRRLPREVEWELAAASEADGAELTPTRRRFPWGDTPPTPEHAHLDAAPTGPSDVNAYPSGDSAFGLRQMIGNVWEWTADAFEPYPGFTPDPYKEFSAPWFTTHKAVRGGSWATRSRMLRNTLRNYYTPDRRDPWIGFRTCALSPDDRP